MGEQTEALAGRFEQANAELIAEVDRLSAQEWTAVCPGEGWTVAVTAHHIAASHAAIANLVKMVADGQELPPITMEMFHRLNAQHAKEHDQCSKAETVELLRRDGASAAAIVRGLDDAQLNRSAAAAFLGETEITARGLIERILIGHVSGHLDSMRAAVVA